MLTENIKAMPVPTQSAMVTQTAMRKVLKVNMRSRNRHSAILVKMVEATYSGSEM